MKIGLVDVDGKKSNKFKVFPNLALMKISAFHKSLGDEVEFLSKLSSYDKVYMSKIFTFTPDYPFDINAKELVKGGTGYKTYNNLPDEIDSLCPDYSLYGCDSAYGFLTRGCIRKCPWCVVPNSEGMIRAYSDIDDFIADKKSAVLMDNNVLAHEHGLRQIEKIIKKGIKVDFNQGLDARLIAENEDIAKLLSKVKWIQYLRMACDTKSQMETVEKATYLLRKYNTKSEGGMFFVYVLAKDIPDALERVEFLRKLNLKPFVQAYRNFETNYVDPEIRVFQNYVNGRQKFFTVSWEEFNKSYRKKKSPVYDDGFFD